MAAGSPWRAPRPNAADRYSRQLGQLDFAAPQDWMCEPAILAPHRPDRAGASGADCGQLPGVAGAGPPHLPFIPVVQGWHLADYLACVDLYRAAGGGPDPGAADRARVGVPAASPTGQIAVIVAALACLGLRLHGFGIKTTGPAPVRAPARLGRLDGLELRGPAAPPALPGCTGHRNCANCLTYAASWRTPHPGRRHVPRLPGQPVRPRTAGGGPHDGDYRVADR